MANEDDERLALKDLVVVYSGDERPRAVGALYNPFGMAAWLNTAGMAMVLVSKRFLLTGPIVVRALRVRGWFNHEEREDLYESSADIPSAGGFIRECLRLLIAGQPFEGIDRPLVLRPRIRGEEFYLTRKV